MFSYFRRTNWLGSTVAATTWGQAIQSETGYAPFGETYNEYTYPGTTQDRSFAGMDQDVVTGRRVARISVAPSRPQPTGAPGLLGDLGKHKSQPSNLRGVTLRPCSHVSLTANAVRPLGLSRSSRTGRRRGEVTSLPEGFEVQGPDG